MRSVKLPSPCCAPTRSRRRPWLFCGAFIFLVALIHSFYTISHGYRGWTAVGPRLMRAYSQWRGLGDESFDFSMGRPIWLERPSTPPSYPLVLRIAVLSIPEEAELREFLRTEVYNATRVPASELVFEVKFFLGRSGDAGLNDVVKLEMNIYNDIELLDVEENTWALSIKRLEALRWAARVPRTEYDFFFTADSDSFVRLVALVRRMNFIRPDMLAAARSTPSLWGQLQPKMYHWPSTGVLVHNRDGKYVGEWFNYPVGMGYLMSSALVARLDAVADKFPKHIGYYSDDLAVGSWIADYVPETWYINDIGGFHDPPGHGKSYTFKIDWSTVLVHHVNLEEMQVLRARNEWKDEWLADDLIIRPTATA